MNYVGSIISNFKGFYQEINSATLNGSIDVVIVKKADGSFVSSPFHVRFGKIGVLRAREKLVDIEVNGISVPLHMKLGEAGEAFFVEQISNNDIDLPAYMATSPIPDTTHHIIEEGLRELDAHPEYWEPHSTVENPTTNPTELLLFTGIHPRPTQNKKTPRHRRRRKPKHRNNSSTSATGTEDSEFSCESDEETLFPMDLSAGDSDGSNRSTASAPCLAPALHHNDHLHHLVNSEWHGNQFASGCHPFSDGDITPITSPIGSRPPTPKSDTEYELGENCSSRLRKSSVSDSPRHITKKKPSSLIDGMDTEWKWGQLPTQSATVTAALSGSTSLSTTSKSSSRVSSTVGSVDDGKEDKIVEKTSGGLFNFMRSTKKLRHQPSQEGIYLDDLDLEAMDPEVAALYLCPSKRANKTKNTTGLADIIDGKADICVRDEVVHSTPVEASAVTIDGAIVIGDETSEATAIDAEDAESGTGDSLPRSPEPSIIQNEYDTQSSKTSAEYMTIGDDIRISLCGCHLDNEHCVKDEIFDEYMVTKECFQEKPDILFDSNLVVKIKDKYYNWQVAGPHIMAMLVFKTELPMHSMNLLKKKYMPKKERKRWWWSRSSREVKEVTSETSLTSNDKTINDTSMDKSITKSIDLAVLDASITKDDTDDSDNMISEDSYTSHEFKKSLKLNSSQIEQLRLKPGMNEVQYSVTTQYQGTTRIKSFIYLWNWDDRIIVSDIDGTITKSDVLGHVLPMIGKDWSQAGIARLYSQAASNGYKFLYLSARAIGQARITRDYLSSVVQQGDVVLPVGPMLLSPSSLISAFHKEVIEKKPEEFKIGCLRDIKALFPSSRNPFYAGFGNKINDVWAYTAVGIPISRIFTVNYKGELRQEISTALNSTYSKLYDIVDHVFPPLVKRKRGDSDDGLESLELFPNCDDFSSFTYWRLPVEIIDDIDLLNIGDTATTATTSPATNNSNTVLSSTNTNTTTDQ